MKQCQGQDSRNVKMKERYQKVRVTGMLCSNGFLPKFGARVADVVCEVVPAAAATTTDFSSSEVRIWFAKNSENDSNTKNVLAFVKDLQVSSSVDVDGKVTSTNASMMNEQNVAWTGLLCVVEGKWGDDFKFDKDVPELKDLLYTKDAGGSAWLNVCKANHWRFGPNCHPLAGFAQFISCLTAAMYIITLPIQPLIGQGIALPDLASFLETERGATFCKAHVKTWAVDVGDVLFVPNGFLAIPLFSNPDVKQSWGHLWSFPVFQKGWANAMSPECKRSLADFHRPHFNDNAGRRMWKQRAETFEQYMVELEVPAAAPS